MSLGHGSQIARNGLVFHYDAANTQKSWRGMPITNLVDPSWSNWSIDGSGQGSIGTRTITSPYECTIVDNNANTRQSISILSGITAGTTYTFSVQYKKNYGTPTLRFQIQAYNDATYLSGMSFATTAQLGILDIEGWQTAKITLTTPASTNRILWFMQDGDDYVTYSHSFSLKNVQCEQNSFATPFVAGTRSNTQAIIDLTKNNTITATSLTYNANGTFSFNGSTNHIITTNAGLSHGTGNFTYSCLAKFAGLPGLGTIFENGFYTNGILIRFETNVIRIYAQYSTTTYTNAFSFIPTVGLWYNLVVTRVGNNLLLYSNGILLSTITFGTSINVVPSNNLMFIGMSQHQAGQCFNGELENAQVYNRALSAAEIAENFEALRGRYGI